MSLKSKFLFPMLASLCFFTTLAQAGELRAGAAKISITPAADAFPYAPAHEHPVVGVHDDVYARALVLEAGKQRVAIVILDVNKVPRSAQLVKAVAQEAGVPESNVLVAASQTHSVLLVSFESGEPNELQIKEMDRLQKGAVEAVRQAKAQLQAARIGFARGESWVNVNGGTYIAGGGPGGGARTPGGGPSAGGPPLGGGPAPGGPGPAGGPGDPGAGGQGPGGPGGQGPGGQPPSGGPSAGGQSGGGARMGIREYSPIPNGPSDKSLDLVRIESVKGEPLALLVNYAVNPIVMYRAATKGDGQEVSGDLPGAVARYLESLPAGAPVVLFTGGAQADQLPLFKAVQAGAKLPEADEGPGGWAILDAQARRLTNSVLDVLGSMQPGVADVTLNASATTVSCPGRAVRHPGGPPAQKPDSASAEAAVPPVNIPVSVIQINDIALAGVGGDVANEIGQHLKAASPVAHTSLISMTAGDVGYVLTDALYNKDPKLGEFGGAGQTPIKPGCAEQAIIQGAIGLMGGGTSK